ncbi:major facilitator superfamily domain-containing protein [Phaeosphaeria sp. MPI-PUGE-AT-0046c]|nr:major facilitator superfamily domain-containing protein [Phaeosphaeria sp. MPI-PUGE-AT-0046c]
MHASLIADSEVPDGGYGWIVVFSGAVIFWWFMGSVYTWGVMQAALVEQKNYEPATLSFVGSMVPALGATLAIPNATLIRKVGARATGLTGVFLLGLGSILAGFAVDSILGLFMTWGLVCGLGASLCFMTASIIPAQYFRAKRGIANGIVYAGGGLGGTAVSFMLNALIDNVGIPWSFRILGFMIIGTGLPAAYLMKERVPIRKTHFVEWNLFKDAKFSLVFAVGVLSTFPLFVPPFFLPLYSKSLGLSSATGAGLVAAFNFCSAIGRLGSGFACDKLGSLTTLFLTLIFSSISLMVMWPLSNSIGTLIALIIINGMANGGFFSTMPTVVGNVFGSARVGVAMGMIVSGWIGGGAIAGYILNASGGRYSSIVSYRPAIFYAGGMTVIATILAAVVRLRVDRNLKKIV